RSAAKVAGRIEDVYVDEGVLVQRGQTVAKMDTAILEAQHKEAEAALERARIAVETALSLVTQREAEYQAAEALIGLRKAELDAAQKRLARSENLAPQGAASLAQLDDDRADVHAKRAAVRAAEAQAAAARAAISQAQSNVISAKAAIEATQASLQRIQADIDDSVLKAPRDGRVQYRVAQPGEVLFPGGVVLNMVDLTDVYMTFFLATELAGRVAAGAEARLVLDAVPQYVVPAKVSFVADVAQFTPKTVETADERQKLMFRIKARIDPDLLRKHLRQVKTGLPGMAYVRLDPQADWPAELQIRLPHDQPART
ncbi:MAG: HlyD family efflux transporter periplasmic adaptor subunit, partial [Gammaproteobacteria bacterium]